MISIPDNDFVWAIRVRSHKIIVRIFKHNFVEKTCVLF